MRIKTKEESQVLIVVQKGQKSVFSHYHLTLELTFELAAGYYVILLKIG